MDAVKTEKVRTDEAIIGEWIVREALDELLPLSLVWTRTPTPARNKVPMAAFGQRIKFAHALHEGRALEEDKVSVGVLEMSDLTLTNFKGRSETVIFTLETSTASREGICQNFTQLCTL